MNNQDCTQYLESFRFPMAFYCSRCNSKRISRLKTVHKYQCMDCHYIFSLTSGTMFHGSHLSLHKWFLAIIFVTNVENLTGKELKALLNITYKTAWRCIYIIRLHQDETLIKSIADIYYDDEDLDLN